MPLSDTQVPNTLSVVMPTHGRRSRLPAVIPPLLDDLSVRELIVVVDGSDDGSIEWLRQKATMYPKLLPVLRDQSGGAQRARADGMVRASSDVILFLDDDIVASESLAQRHLVHHQNRDGIVVVGFMPVAIPEQRTSGQFATYLYAEEYLQICRIYEQQESQILRSLWWGNVSIRHSDAERVGLVSPGIEHLYHEDQDFGLRCLRAGLVGIFDRSLDALHVHSRSSDAFIRDAQTQGAARVILHQRHEDLIGTLDPNSFAEGLPFPASLLVMNAGSRRVSQISTSILKRILRFAGNRGWFRIETDVGKVLRRINQRYGAEVMWQTDSSRIPLTRS